MLKLELWKNCFAKNSLNFGALLCFLEHYEFPTDYLIRQRWSMDELDRSASRRPTMAGKSMLPVLSPDGNLSRYLDQIRTFPMLEPGEEYMLAKSWKDKGDVKAAHKLVTSHLRLVAKIAMGYRGYGLPVSDLISEGNLGMMHAVKKFEPEKGFRLATYAMWWIKAAIQEYILRSWSLVKIGTTAGQKKLFFNLRRVKGQIQAIDDGDSKARACNPNCNAVGRV